MGDDFIVKIKDHYNRKITKSLADYVRQPPLFRPRAKERIAYPCKLNDTCEAPAVGRCLTLRVIGDSIELLDQHRVIGFIGQEAYQDAVDDFKANPDCQGVVTVQVASVFEDVKRVDVSPSSEVEGGN